MASPPPADVATEQVVIGAVLDGLVNYADLRDTLSSGDLYDPRHRLTWAIIGALSAKGKAPSVPEVAAELHAAGHLEAAGGSAYLLELINAPAVADVRSLAVRIADLSRKRRALTIIDDAAAHGRNGITDVGAWIQSVATQLSTVAGVAQPEPERINLLGANDIFGKLPSIPWAIQGLDICPGAPTLVAGYGYSGKSMALQALGLHVAAGMRVWGSFEAKQGGFIHFDYEQGEHLTRLRYQRIAYAYDITPQDLEGHIGLVCYPTFYLDEPESFPILEKLCTGKSIAIFDSFRAACRHTDENSSEARVPLDMLARLSERTGCSMLVIHHARKPRENDAGSARDSIRGSGALYDACGSVFVLEGKPEDPERTVYHCKARVSGKVQDSMTLRIEDWGEPIGDGSVPGIRVTVSKAPTADERERQAIKARYTKLEQEVRDLFRTQPERKGGVDALAKSLGRKASDVRSAVNVLIEIGDLQVTGATSDRGYRYVGT